MTKPILEHFGPTALQPPRDFAQEGPTFYGKPHGLWLSVRGEDDWLEWCKAEDFGCPERFQHRTVVHLAAAANILWIRTVAELDAFDDEFGKPDPDMASIQPMARKNRWTGIDWAAVAERYDGIVIAPYQWARRLGERCSWYYGWDCASGCIWKAAAIANLEEIAPPTFEDKEAEAA